MELCIFSPYMRSWRGQGQFYHTLFLNIFVVVNSDFYYRHLKFTTMKPNTKKKSVLKSLLGSTKTLLSEDSYLHLSAP